MNNVIIINLKIIIKLFISDLLFLMANIYNFFYKNKYRNKNKLIVNKKVLINTSYHWSHSWFEYMMSERLVGTQQSPIAFVCDGMPYCELEITSLKRPSCAVCALNTKRKLNHFGIKYVLLSECITKLDIIEIDKFIEKNDIINLEKIDLHGINIRKYSLNNLYHFNKGVVEPKEYIDLFKRIIKSSLITSKSIINLVKKYNIDLLITTNGKFIQSGIAIEIFKNSNKEYITWDAFTQGEKFIVGYNCIAHDQSIDDKILKDFDFTRVEYIKWTDNYFKLQSKSLNVPYKYYDDTNENDIKLLNNILFQSKNKKIISYYPNVEWDATALNLDSIFTSVRDALTYLVNFVKENSEFFLIVRLHPAEIKVPFHMQTKNSISSFLKELNLDPNSFLLIDSANNLKSYDLAKISNINIVYSSTFGIELPLMKIKPIVLSNCYYSFYSFVNKPSTRMNLYSLLKSDVKSYISEDELLELKKIAYLAKNKRLFNINSMRGDKFLYLSYIKNLDNRIVENFNDLLNGKRNEFLFNE